VPQEPGQLSRYIDWLQAGRPRGRSWNHGRVKNFLFSTSSRPALGSTEPPIQWVPGALFAGVKRLGREADRSPLTSAEVKKEWIYTSTPHTPSRQHRDNFTFYLLRECHQTPSTFCFSVISKKRRAQKER
jgi:hypothetical protein